MQRYATQTSTANGPGIARDDKVELSVNPADEIKTTTCYMCACRCGIRVYLRDGKVRYIEGNRNHPVNKGVLCGKGSAGIMQHYAPSRLRAPLKRVGERGSGEYQEISWDEALTLATTWLGETRAKDPSRLAFFTGRDQSQSLTGWWAMQYGTQNFAAHGGFCSVNMAAGGLYTFGGSFWEFGEPDWDHTKYFLLFGVAEDHGSNPIKIGLGKLKARGAKIVSINPVRTGYNAIADEWLGVKPGTDGLLVGALIHELLRTEQVDLDYLVRYTNAPWLVIKSPGSADDGLFARDADGKPVAFDKTSGAVTDASRVDITPALVGERTLAYGRQAVPVFQLLAERYLSDEYSPEAVAAETGVPASTIRRIAAEMADVAFKQTITLPIQWTDWAGRKHDSVTGRPVSMHAMRGISAHSNGFHTCRLLHLLQILLGTIDVPGGFRYKAPYPKPPPPALKPVGKPGQVKPNTPLPGGQLGFPTGPEDLLVDADGRPIRIDKAFSWDAPLSAHGLMHMVITNAATADPYPVDILFMYMANMSWNSSMNVQATLDYLTAKNEDGSYKIPKIIYSDAYASEMIAYADLILPDTTYLERYDCISLLDRPISEPDGPADAIRWPVVEPDRDVRGFQDVLIDLGARLRLPGFVDEHGAAKYPGGYPDYIVNHERAPGIGPLAGWRGESGESFGRGKPNPKQIERYKENGAFHFHHLEPGQRYMKHANKAYLEFAQSVGFVGNTEPIIFQLYCEPLQKFRLAAQGHGPIQPPEGHRRRIERYFDPLPFWYAPFEGTMIDERAFPMHAITQRPMHMYHSWGSQNAWLRQITSANRLYMHRLRGAELDIEDGDWVWISSHIGRVRAQVQLMEGVNPDTVWTWNAIGKRAGAWALDADAPEAQKGFLLNHLIAELLPPREGGYRYSNSDPVTGQAAWYDLRVKIEKAPSSESAGSWPQFEPVASPPGMKAPAVSQFGREFKKAK
ncbi:MAG: molybdopterin oxidoreductase family protein [Hyphomicrobiaceae bacterium]